MMTTSLWTDEYRRVFLYVRLTVTWGSPTYELSKYLANLLKHLCQDHTYTVDNGKEFAEFIRFQKLDHDETIGVFLCGIPIYIDSRPPGSKRCQTKTQRK